MSGFAGHRRQRDTGDEVPRSKERRMNALEKAIAAWGSEMPRWVRSLAVECLGASVRKAAARIEVSPAMVSLAINRKREDLEFVRTRVEQHLLTIRLSCPVLGIISISQCSREQGRPFSSANPLKVQLYRACRDGCPYYKESKT